MRSYRAELEVQANKVSSVTSRAEAAEREVLDLKDGKKAAEDSAKASADALEAKEQELSGAKDEVASLKAKVAALENDLASDRKKNSELQEKIKELSGREAYIASVRRFMGSRTFTTVINTEAGPSFRMGFEAAGVFIGEGVAFSSAEHSFEAYLSKEMARMSEAGSGAAEAEGASKAPEPTPSEDDIPLNMLYPSLSDDEGSSEGEEEVEDLAVEKSAGDAGSAKKGADDGSAQP